MRYIVNENCIGCGLCNGICSDVFDMADDGFAKAIDSEVPEDLETAAAEAKDSCPVAAIEEA